MPSHKHLVGCLDSLDNHLWYSDGDGDREGLSELSGLVGKNRKSTRGSIALAKVTAPPYLNVAPPI